MGARSIIRGISRHLFVIPTTRNYAPDDTGQCQPCRGVQCLQEVHFLCAFLKCYYLNICVCMCDYY